MPFFNNTIIQTTHNNTTKEQKRTMTTTRSNTIAELRQFIDKLGITMCKALTSNDWEKVKSLPNMTGGLQVVEILNLLVKEHAEYKEDVGVMYSEEDLQELRDQNDDLTNELLAENRRYLKNTASYTQQIHELRDDIKTLEALVGKGHTRDHRDDIIKRQTKKIDELNALTQAFRREPQYIVTQLREDIKDLQEQLRDQAIPPCVEDWATGTL